MKNYFSFLTFLLILPGLHELPAQTGFYAITDSANYSLNRPSAQVKFTIHNYSDSSLYLPHCGERIDIFLLKKIEEQWIGLNGWGSPCLAIYSMGIKKIEKDSSYTDYWFADIGNFKLLFLYSFDPKSDEFDSLMSNEFTVSKEVADIKNDSPDNSNFYLSRNYPNPFNPATTFNYFIPEQSDVKIEIVDMLGRTLFTLLNEKKDKGNYRQTLNLNNLSSGTYLIRLQAGKFIKTEKILLLK